MTAYPPPHPEQHRLAVEDPARASPPSSSRLKATIALGGWLERLPERLRAFGKMLGEMIYGATVYDMVRDLNKERGMIERLFILAVFGDVLGVPILPPYYALRLLPYVVPCIRGWRHSMLRERDLTDLCDQEFT